MDRHSYFNDFQGQSFSGVAILPFASDGKGPAPRFNPDDFQPKGHRKEAVIDVIDEAILFYRANVFLKEYEVKGDADRLLLYLTLYITELLKEFSRQSSLKAAEGVAYQLANKSWPIPGSKGFPLAVFYKDSDKKDQDFLESYLLQARLEIGSRLAKKVFRKGKGDKWWLLFSSYEFLGKSLTKSNN